MPMVARPYATHWQDWVNLGLGIWLGVSPWLLGFADVTLPAWNAWLIGVVVAAVAVAALIQYVRWVEWVNVAIGVWLVVAPWVLAFAGTGLSRAVFDHVIVGLLVAVLALWDALVHGRQGGMVWD